MGTSTFSGVILNALMGYGSGEVVGVFAQPDKTAGRGLKLSLNAVKKIALDSELPLFQPASLRPPEVERFIADLRPDFIISAAYGLILPKTILDIPSIAALNVHASLLPLYRGAAPIQAAIMDNWQPGGKTGVSIMEMAPAMDAGPVYAAREVAINNMAYPELQSSLAREGAALLLQTLDGILYSGLRPVPQNEALATYAPKLSKNDGKIYWNQPAMKIDALVRAMTPWPGAQTIFSLKGQEKDMPVVILPGQCGVPCQGVPAGQIHRDKKGLAIACADNWYILDKVHPAGRREMAASAFANGQCVVKRGLCGSCLPLE